MGLKNAPEIFMQMMNNLFEDMLDQGVVVFLDDMFIYSSTVEEHFKLLEKYCRRVLGCHPHPVCAWGIIPPHIIHHYLLISDLVGGFIHGIFSVMPH